MDGPISLGRCSRGLNSTRHRDPDTPFGEGFFVSKASLNKDLLSDNTEHDPKIPFIMQITEALRLQLDVQRRLREQLEFTNQRLPYCCAGLRIAEALKASARCPKVTIEAQSRMLQQMFEEKVKTNKNGSQNTFPTED
ncbi:hypothetical protein OPV22_025044 [Ensete ventricosum]|uniref:MYB-CC type transcription factor LHEQLE-containing domain-containing protein n=1 Tax=Ensete ventricosum TaxID=4639 RepID=A0AAV8P720_ENSVE|nr:hypothetical protein OPV22_025044 [Ensete ventricosum]